MPLRRGIQVASTVFKRVPMFDPVCAAVVAGHIAKFYGGAGGPCTCPGGPAKHDFDNDACDSKKVVPYNAMPLIEAKCGRYTKGKHKGALRGWASIEVVTEGGWKRHGPGERNGRVVYPGTVLSVSIGDDFSGKTYLEVGR